MSGERGKARSLLGATHPPSRLTRRSLLTVTGAALLGACTDTGPSGSPSPSAAPTLPTSTVDSLTWAQWPDYIDVKGKRHPSLEAFEKESGISVTYDEVINDNRQYVESISAKLDAKQPVGADIMTLTTWMAAQLVEDGLLQKIPPVPNGANLIDALARPDWDPAQAYSMPWQAGLTGIAYDARRVDRAIGSVNELLTRDDLKGRVGLLTEFPDAMGLLLLSRGLDLATVSVDQVAETIDYLKGLVAQGRLAGVYGNEYLDALDSGEVIATMAWSGDILQRQFDNPYLKFVLPEEGLMIFSDNLLVPAASKAASGVANLINYFYEPKVAAQVAAWVNYICPVQGAQEIMAETDPDLAASPLIFPDSTILDRAHQFPKLPRTELEGLRRDYATLAASV